MKGLAEILTLIASKKSDYESYDFSQEEGDALRIFFDLSQEFDDLNDFHVLCVAIPKGIFRLNASLYLLSPKVNNMVLVARTDESDHELESRAPADVKPATYPYRIHDSLYFPVRGNELLIDQLPFEARDTVLGILVLYPSDSLDSHQELFFEKYANRIGFNIHNRYLI